MRDFDHQVFPPAPTRVALAVLTAALALILMLSIVTALQTPDLENSFKSGPPVARVNQAITYTIVAVNAGGPAQGVALSDSVPNGAIYIRDSCTYRKPGDDPQNCGPLNPLWEEDLAAGDRITTSYSVLVITNSMNRSLQNCAYLSWDGNQKEMCVSTIANPGTYLPVVVRNPPPLADLQVSSLLVEPSNPVVGQPVTITLEIQNVGELPAGKFWVDFYLDPDPPPTQANQIWGQLGEHGIAWFVSEGLEPGQSVVLTSLSGYASHATNWPGEFEQSGEHVLYAFADSWEGTTWYGAVRETHEGLDNRYGPVTVNVAARSTGTTNQADD